MPRAHGELGREIHQDERIACRREGGVLVCRIPGKIDTTPKMYLVLQWHLVSFRPFLLRDEKDHLVISSPLDLDVSVWINGPVFYIPPQILPIPSYPYH